MHSGIAELRIPTSSAQLFGMINKCQILPIKELPGMTYSSNNKTFVNSQSFLKMTVSDNYSGMESQRSPLEISIHLPDLSPRKQNIFERFPLLQKAQEGHYSKSSKEYIHQKDNCMKVNGGYSSCYGASGKKDTMEMIMTTGHALTCTQNPVIQSGNSSTQDHTASCERVSQTGQLTITHSDTRSSNFQDSLGSTSPCMNGNHSTHHIKQECPNGYKVLPGLSANGGTSEGTEMRDSTSMHPEIDPMNNSFTNSLSSYLFNNELSSSPSPLLLGSPQHSARLQSGNLKKRCLSVVPSSSEGIDITAIIRTSQTSLVACMNGLRANSTGISSHPRGISVLGARKSSDSQCCPETQNSCSLTIPACLVSFSEEQDSTDCEQLQMQQLDETANLSLMMNNAAIQNGLSDGCQKLSFLKQEPVDEFSPNSDLFQHHHGLPPPYHLHQHFSHTQGALSHVQGPHSPKSFQPNDGDELDNSGKQVCRWIDCNAMYDQQDELVRHIEKMHIDQRKGEDFTCFWAGCVRRYKPFNARYKLLIHMRVHSGEKPNKCMETLARLEKETSGSVQHS
ncbi:zinc finger protein GLIS3-like [Latimeria chalumnae]|uniref:zinc finger protein GLIS3-like n=1 Tax=Latimeria chalumnae TaxID=7897 RepID=UPI00313F1E26